MSKNTPLRAALPAPHVRAQSYALAVAELREASLQSVYTPIAFHPAGHAYSDHAKRDLVRFENGVWGVLKTPPLKCEIFAETLVARFAAAAGYAAAPTFCAQGEPVQTVISVIPFQDISSYGNDMRPDGPAYLSHYGEILPFLFWNGPDTDRAGRNVCGDANATPESYREFDFAISKAMYIVQGYGYRAADDLTSCLDPYYHPTVDLKELSFGDYERGLRKLENITPATIDRLCRMVANEPALRVPAGKGSELSQYFTDRRAALLAPASIKTVKAHLRDGPACARPTGRLRTKLFSFV